MQLYLRYWAKELDIPILSIDYSLAPEFPYPRQVEEIFLAYCWALNNSASLGNSDEEWIVLIKYFDVVDARVVESIASIQNVSLKLKQTFSMATMQAQLAKRSAWLETVLVQTWQFQLPSGPFTEGWGLLMVSSPSMVRSTSGMHPVPQGSWPYWIQSCL